MKEIFGKPLGKTLVVLLALVIVAAGIFGIGILVDPYGGRIAPEVTIGGLEVGNMTPYQARKALKEGMAGTVLARELTLSLPEETLGVTLKDLEIKLNVTAALKDAYEIGRKNTDVPRQMGLLPYLTISTEPVEQLLSDYASRHDTTLTQPSFALTGEAPDLSTENSLDSITCQSLTITAGLPESHLDVGGAVEKILAAYDQAYTYVTDVPLESDVTAQPEAPDLEKIAGEVCREPVNDSLNLVSYGFDYGSYGYSFDREEGEKALAQAGYGETVTLAMTCTAPEITGENAYFRDVLGSCKTKHNTNENRNNNLRLLSQAIDGYILQPGEEFSYNAVVGERTKERGYLPAPAYSGNRLTDSVGGGVCQGSSTLYNCVLIADLEVTNRLCHGASINYLPLGLDAAVNWGTTDFCFRNNWNFPIKLQARVTEEYLEMEILGTDEKDYYIELQAYSWREGDVTWATSYQLKYDKETGELRSKDKIGYSTYYDL